MPFLEEADLADMLSDAGVPVTWQPSSGDPVTRNGLFERHSEPVLDPMAVPARDAVPSVLVERAYFADVQVGDTVTVDGEAWVVRDPSVPMRSLLQLSLTKAGA